MGNERILGKFGEKEITGRKREREEEKKRIFI